MPLDEDKKRSSTAAWFATLFILFYMFAVDGSELIGKKPSRFWKWARILLLVGSLVGGGILIGHYLI